MSGFLMKPKNDFAFKEIMMNENARIGFISAVLKIETRDIRKTRIMNTELRKVHEDTRSILYTDKMEFHVIELPKLPRELKEESDDILLWAKFINADEALTRFV